MAHHQKWFRNPGIVGQPVVPFMGGNAQGIVSGNVLEAIENGRAQSRIEPAQKVGIQIEMPGGVPERHEAVRGNVEDRAFLPWWQGIEIMSGVAGCFPGGQKFRVEVA